MQAWNERMTDYLIEKIPNEFEEIDREFNELSEKIYQSSFETEQLAQVALDLKEYLNRLSEIEKLQIH